MNNVELELMGLFATVVEQGSFTGAAEVLGMPKSSVSQKISRLESRLGVRLLQRTTRRLSLTPQGEVYVAHCQELLALARSANLAMARLRAAPGGRVRITAPEATGTLLLGRILAEFRALYPEVVLELTLCDEQLDLVGEGYDLALRELALHDGGIALLPAHVCGDDLAAGRLLKVLPDLLVPVNPFYLIYPSREHLAPALRSLMDFVAERLPFA